MPAARVRLNLSPLRRYQTKVVQGLRLMNGQISARIVPEWQRAFFGYQRRRFEANAAGGGDWPPLAESTLRSDDGGRRGILWVGGTLWRSLTPGQPGNLAYKVRAGRKTSIRFGIGGPAPVPDSDLSLGDLVRIHHNGTGHVPRRPLLYPLDPATKRRCREIVRRVLSDTTRGWR